LLYDPAAQSTHDGIPGSALIVPASHTVQPLLFALLKWPLGQIKHVFEPSLSL